MPPSEAEVRELVSRILRRLLETRPSAAPAETGGFAQARGGAGALVDEATVRALAPASTLAVPPGVLVTPLARQVALERRITLTEGHSPVVNNTVPAGQRVAIGADHGGYTLKEALKPHLRSLGYEVTDCGTHSTDPVDYPDIAYAVARLVADGKCANGIIVDGAGIGSCMAANKVPGVRAALCYDHATAINSREHNHANVLTLGAGLIGTNLAKQIVGDWLATPFGPGRHAKRVEKIMAIERRYLR
jgi:ribose 5-phosphate isomerase B